MKSIITLFGCMYFLFLQGYFLSDRGFTAVASANDSWKHFYGIAQSDKPSEDIKYARQMGYEYIAINPSVPVKEYRKNPQYAGLKFYLIDPYWHPKVLSGCNKDIDITKPLSDAERDFYNQNMVWKGYEDFPFNLATGYHSPDNPSKFSVMWDFQQQKVIDEVIEKIIRTIKRYEDEDLSFTFGGYLFDEPKLAGEFYTVDEKGNNTPVSLSYWTDEDSGLVHSAITHEYETYTEGRAAFYKQLFKRTREEWPDMKIVTVHDDIYKDWLKVIDDRVDGEELMPDALFQASPGTSFVDDNQIFVSKDSLGSTQQGERGEYQNRLYAAMAAINGAWYNWFDNADGQGIIEVSPRLQLIRCLPNWDNLNNVSLLDREWDGSVYRSTKSYGSCDVMYSRHPGIGKLFAVFLTMSGVITLNPGETVTSVGRTDGFFVESEDGGSDVVIAGNEIRLKNRKNIGEGYIFTVSSDAHAGTGTTGMESDGTPALEGSNGGDNVEILPVMGVFERGKSRDSRSNRNSTDKSKGTVRKKGLTSQQSVSALKWQQVPIRTKAQKTAGLSGGEGFQEIFGMTYAKSNPNVAYFIVDQSGVYKSTDGGTTWARKIKGFLANGGSTVAVDPTNENIVLAAAGAMDHDNVGYSGIIRSTDGGENWSRTYTADLLWPENSSGARGGTLIAFTNDGSKVYAGLNSTGLLRSGNDGATWEKVPKSGGGYVLDGIRIYDVKTHPTDNTTVFVVANDGLYKVTNSDAVATVTKINTPTIPKISAIHPSNANILYYSNKTAIYKSTNGGSSWANITGAIPVVSTTVITGLSISPADGNYLFVGARNCKKYYSNNGGTTWIDATSDLDVKNAYGWVSRSASDNTDSMEPANYFGSVFALHPTDKNVALTCSTENRIKKTTNGGITWRYSGNGWSGARASAYGWADSQNEVIFHVDFGVYTSPDGGDTFKFANHPRFSGHRSAMAGAVAPNNPNFIVAAIGDWTSNTIGITENGGSSWKLLTPQTDGNCKYIAFHPQNSNIIYAGNKKITRSGIGVYSVTSLTKTVARVYPKDGNIVYAKGGSGSNTVIYKSKDGGATWLSVATIPAPTSDVLSFAVTPNNPDKFYVIAYNKGVYIVDNGAVSLKALPADQLGMIAPAYIEVDPNNANTIYVGMKHSWVGQANGVFRSTDSGNTWENITYNLGPEFNVWALAVNPYNSCVYVGSSNGTWKLPPPNFSGVVPLTTTGSATDITSDSATVNGTVNANGLPATVWFEYGTTSGSYGSTSPTQSVSGSGNTTVSIGISGLSASTTYYYRLVAQNSAGTNYGSEMSFVSASGTGIAGGLQAHYVLDEGAGTIAADVSENGNNGAINGASWATGKNGGGLSFDGNDYVININPSSGLKPSTEVAIAAWVKTSATDTGGAEVISMGDSYALRVETDGNIKFFYYNGSGYKSVRTTGVNVLNGAWHHIVGQKIGTALQVYVDGSSKVSTNNTGTILYTLGTDLFIGKYGNGGTSYDFNGSIDDVRIYNRTLSDQDVLALYNTTSADTTAPMCSVSINDNASYTNSSTVTLALSATDDVGVTGYYLSTSSSTPLASDTVWTTVSSTTSYSASVPYTLSNGDGGKTIYVWYKDEAGNVSNTASDSITLDTIIPVVTITSPTSGSTYTTSSSTISLGGNASDNTSSIGSVTWSNSKGGSGMPSGTTSWSISGISLSSGDNVITVTATDGANNTAVDTITVTYDATPRVMTGSATNLTSNSALLNGMVNASGLTATAWFEYGTISGSYGSQSSLQGVSGSEDTTVSISIGGLSAGQTYYYRIAAQNSAGIAYGSEMSFTIVDATAPECSISINNGDSYTNSSAVTLTLSATDNVGVTGYYLSASSSVPLASAAGWTSVNFSTSYTGNVSYTLDSGDGDKTVYVWYKDAAGNVSNAASDSIHLDATVPVISISSPTSDSIYTTTSSTISLGGNVSDSTSGVSEVTWSSNTGGSGTASGTVSWSISDISLSSGENVITVTARDEANNTGTDIITVICTPGVAPLTTTGLATDITSDSAMLNGTVNVNGLSSSVWFEYGTTSGSYGNISSTQSVNGTSDTAVSISINGLSASTTYYYRLVAQNSVGMKYGSEMSFVSVSGTDGTSGPQVHYTLDEGSGTIATDVSGNGNNGTINGATWSTGKSGGGLSFDGGDGDYMIRTNPSSGLKPSSEVAIAAWIKTGATDTGGAEVVSMGDSYALRVEKDGNIRFFYYNGSGYKSVRTTGVNVLDGAWHHIVGQKTGTALQVYVDGGSQVTTDNTGTILYTLGTDLFIGRHGKGGTDYDFNGSIDEVRIYNRALSNQEAQDLYNTTSTVVTNGLQSLYVLDEGSGTIANDVSGNGNNGTINGATWSTGKSGGGLSFDGDGDYVTKTNPSSGLKPSSEVAIAAWIKTGATDSGGAEVVSMGDSYALRVEKDGNIRFFYYNGSGYKSVRTTGVNVLDNTWHHIVGQKTGTTLQVYVDGSSQVTTNNTGTILYTLGTDLLIGRHGKGGANYDFNGSIDDVRIYNRALSNQEAQMLFGN